MAHPRNEPLDTLLELGKEQARDMKIMGAGLIIGPLMIVGAFAVGDCLQRPERVNECVESLEHRQLPTDLCQDRCFRNNYLNLQIEYRRLELSQDEIDYVGLAYRRARERCNDE
ncbi:hypothetical protein HYX11_02750 [Candidatus Woesearchaeota archaeon]|nr:hypothetical protein [Candidatus Woesearchaeota archaeon]